jgi:hypothetical protein
MKIIVIIKNSAVIYILSKKNFKNLEKCCQGNFSSRTRRSLVYLIHSIAAKLSIPFK